MTARDVIAKAIKDETDTFHNPVYSYIEREAAQRFDDSHEDIEWWEIEKDWEKESYLIIADAIIPALTAAGYSIVHESEIHGATRERCMRAVCSECERGTPVGKYGYHERDSGYACPCHAHGIRALPDGGVE